MCSLELDLSWITVSAIASSSAVSLKQSVKYRIASRRTYTSSFRLTSPLRFVLFRCRVCIFVFLPVSSDLDWGDDHLTTCTFRDVQLALGLSFLLSLLNKLLIVVR
jgi:hypothetical protein